MNILRLLFVCLFSFGIHVGFCQNSVDPGSDKSENSRGYYSPKRAKTVSTKRRNVKHTARFEFYKRVEMAAKDKQRMLRKLSKPQFSDPTYFGHKRKPRKRIPHKMKFCHECHIRH